MKLRVLTIALTVSAWCGVALAQYLPHALDAYAVTVSSTAVVAVAGSANGCNITSTVDLIVDATFGTTGNAAGTSVSTTSQLQKANASPYQCGFLGANAKVSVNCSGGGTCAWTGMRW